VVGLVNCSMSSHCFEKERKIVDDQSIHGYDELWRTSRLDIAVRGKIPNKISIDEEIVHEEGTSKTSELKMASVFLGDLARQSSERCPHRVVPSLC